MTAIDSRLKSYWKKVWTPPKVQTVLEWSEENLYLPASASPIPGRYSTEYTPHVREVLNAYTDPETSHIILCWAAQSAKTTTELVCKCYNIVNYEGAQIFLMPSQDMAKSYSESRLQPIIEATPILKSLKPHNRDKYKKLEMHMTNGVINLIGGNSATNLASRSAGRLFTDEIDKLKRELKDEADPLSLLFERAKWFPNRKIFLTSTPTVESGHIWTWFLKGTQEYYYVPCPSCKEHFTPEWYKHMKWSDDPELTNEETAETAYLECPNCQFHIQDKNKYIMLEEGVWKSHNPKAPKTMRSFHYNEIMSHITRWSELVLKFLKATDRQKVGDNSELRNFVNSSLGEPWIEYNGAAISEDQVLKLVDLDRPRGAVPNWVNGLVCGVDTQANGFYYVIMGFGKFNTSAVISEGFVDNFETLEASTIHARFGERQLQISRMFIDAQGGGQKINGMNRTDEVYRFARKWGGNVTPCVGRGRNVNSDINFRPIDPGVTAGGLQKCVWNTIVVKDMLFTKMRINTEEPGSFHIHKDADKEFLIAMRSEFKNEKGDYQQIKGRENHYLDCVALCFLGARIMPIEYWDNTPKQTNKKPVVEQINKPTVPTPW